MFSAWGKGKEGGKEGRESGREEKERRKEENKRKREEKKGNIQLQHVRLPLFFVIYVLGATKMIKT